MKGRNGQSRTKIEREKRRYEKRLRKKRRKPMPESLYPNAQGRQPRRRAGKLNEKAKAEATAAFGLMLKEKLTFGQALAVVRGVQRLSGPIDPEIWRHIQKLIEIQNNERRRKPDARVSAPELTT